MKRLLLAFLILLIPVVVHAADTKVQDLTAATTTTTDDKMLIIDDPAGSPADKSITIDDLFTTLTTSGSLSIVAGGSGTDVIVASNGNVGIGTTAPSQKLEISGIAKIGSLASQQQLLINDSHGGSVFAGLGALSSNTVVKALTFFVSNGSVSEAMRIRHDGNVGIATTAPTAKLHVIQTGAADAFRVDDQASDTSPFVIDQNGNVGIGTTAPSGKLDVEGGTNNNFEVQTTGSSITTIWGKSATTNGVNLQLNSAGVQKFIFGLSDSDDAGTGEEFFIGRSFGGATPDFWISTAGNVGIGGTSASSQLEVTGDIKSQGIVISGATIQFSSLDCTGNTNGGALTADASGNVTCSDDDGGSGLWTDGGALTYLTSTADDFAIGGTDATAALHFDTGTGVLTVSSVTTSGSGQSSASDLTVSGTFTLPASTGVVVDSNGEAAVDTSDGQFVYYSTSKRVINPKGTFCINKIDLVAGDDNYPIMSFADAATITDVWCSYIGTGSTVAQISLEDGSGNAMTHTTPTCTAHGTAATLQSVTAAGSVTAGEIVRFDVDNTPDPTTDDYTICVGFTYDAQ